MLKALLLPIIVIGVPSKMFYWAQWSAVTSLPQNSVAFSCILQYHFNSGLNCTNAHYVLGAALIICRFQCNKQSVIEICRSSIHFNFKYSLAFWWDIAHLFECKFMCVPPQAENRGSGKAILCVSMGAYSRAWEFAHMCATIGSRFPWRKTEKMRSL